MGSASVGPSGFVSNIRTSARRIASNISPVQHNNDIPESLEPEDSTEATSSGIRRSSTSSTSKSSHTSPYKSRTGSSSTISVASQLADRKPVSAPVGIRQPAHTSNPSLQRPSTFSSSLDVPSTNGSGYQSTASPNMAGAMTPNGTRLDLTRPPSNSQSNVAFGLGGGTTIPVPALPQATAGLSQNPSTIYQQIHDVSSKRISTLDYLRKAHDGRVYWFNTLLFTKPDLSKIPFFEARKLARRATNYLFLGLSLPAVLDLNATNAQDYLRALNALLAEFESYQQTHPPDGSTSSSLSRARIPQMFKRAAHTSTKGRRTSSAADIGFPMTANDTSESKSMNGSTGAAAPNASSFPASEQDLAPGEEYMYLLTPSLPFDPDFFETFATLCDVLIDCYTRIMSLIPSPNGVGPGIGDIFAKADAKMRKVMVSGIIKEFEEASRSGAKAEFAGLGKVVLGGLM